MFFRPLAPHFDKILGVKRQTTKIRGKQEGNGSTSLLKGGDNMTVLEVLGLLNLLAVVIFGVISVTKK